MHEGPILNNLALTQEELTRVVAKYEDLVNSFASMGYVCATHGFDPLNIAIEIAVAATLVGGSAEEVLERVDSLFPVNWKTAYATRGIAIGIALMLLLEKSAA